MATHAHARARRCDPAALRRFAALAASPEARASVHTLLVVDDPASPRLGEIQALADYSPNHLVRVAVMPENAGASQVRNSGMAQSFGDWTVLVGTREPQRVCSPTCAGRGLAVCGTLRSCLGAGP